ncbi:hypothetical protein TNCV_813831 [Trichonephila clavipes]|nr:hypothetical protein TNCV_813831 [Trichonephila clavipes]
MQVTVRFDSQFRGRNPWGWSGASLSSPSTNHTRGLTARQLFRVHSCLKGTIHLQTFVSSPGFEPSPYGTAVSVTNHYTILLEVYVPRSGKFHKKVRPIKQLLTVRIKKNG